jgi:hypothetical protein
MKQKRAPSHTHIALFPDEPAPRNRDGKPITLRNARDGECRWMYASGIDSPICGQAVQFNKAWCPYHFTRVFNGSWRPLRAEGPHA